MGRLQRLVTAVIVVAVCSVADGPSAFAGDEDSVRRILAASQEAMLERHYGQAVHVLRRGLKEHPQDNRLWLELGRAYLSAGDDGQGFAELLLRYPQASGSSDAAATIFRESQRLVSLVNTYLDVLRFDAGARSLRREPILIPERPDSELDEVVGESRESEKGKQ